MCHGYTNLSSADRKITQIASSFLCDNTLVFGWYRFNGDAGTRMATTCPSFTLGRCAALRQGWLSGTHPNAEEGEVSRKVCFTFKTCCSRTVHVKVKNCGSYYVYRLQPPPDCPYRYCGAVWTKLKQPSFPSPHSTPAPRRALVRLNVDDGYMNADNFTSWSSSQQQAGNCRSE